MLRVGTRCFAATSTVTLCFDDTFTIVIRYAAALLPTSSLPSSLPPSPPASPIGLSPPPDSPIKQPSPPPEQQHIEDTSEQTLQEDQPQPILDPVTLGFHSQLASSTPPVGQDDIPYAPTKLVRPPKKPEFMLRSHGLDTVPSDVAISYVNLLSSFIDNTESLYLAAQLEHLE